MPQAEYALNLSFNIAQPVIAALEALIERQENQLLINELINILEPVYPEIHKYFLEHDKDHILGDINDFATHVRDRSELGTSSNESSISDGSSTVIDPKMLEQPDSCLHSYEIEVRRKPVSKDSEAQSHPKKRLRQCCVIC